MLTFSGSFFQDSTVAYTTENVRACYIRHLRQVTQDVCEFVARWGPSVFYDIAHTPHRLDNDKINEIIDLRVLKNIPMKELMGWDDNGFIEFGFGRTVNISKVSENHIHVAAHLPPI